MSSKTMTPQFTVIIPSKSTGNLTECVRAIRRCEEDCPIIAVDDGLYRKSIEDLQVTVIDGEKPFIFARNCNFGITAAGDCDVILLNDDALLQTPGGFTKLARQSQVHPEYGIISAVCKRIGNPNQKPRRVGLRSERQRLCFVCVYIPRSTIDAIGLLDEQFIHYGMEDDDYCLRAILAGMKLGVYDGCVVNHERLRSEHQALGTNHYRENLEIFKRKWGVTTWRW